MTHDRHRHKLNNNTAYVPQRHDFSAVKKIKASVFLVPSFSFYRDISRKDPVKNERIAASRRVSDTNLAGNGQITSN